MAKRRRHYRFHDFGDMADLGMDDGLGFAATTTVAGPLIGGGLAQLGIIGSKMMFAGKYAKWAGLIGTVLGGGVSAFLAYRPKTRTTGTAGLVTALLIGIPRQIEDIMLPSVALKDAFGLIVNEMGNDEIEGFGADTGVQLLDSGAGSTGVMGSVVSEQITGAEEDMQGPVEVMGAGPVEMLGNNGFGSNFLSDA